MTTLELIDLNKKLIYKIASKFYGEDIEDLYQVGVIGVLKAYENYKKNGTTKFSTYAYDYIFGEMYNLVNTSKHYKVSKDLIRLYKKLEVTRYTLAQSIDKIPSNKELSEYLNIELSLIDSATNIGNTISFDDDNETSRNLGEVVSYNDNVSIDDKIFLQECLDTLSDNEKKIIEYRYYNDLSQSEVASLLSLSQSKVSRTEAKSLQKMRVFNKA